MSEKMERERTELLRTRLRDVLIALEVLRPDADPSGPELVMAAEDFCNNTDATEATRRIKKAVSI